MPEITPISRVKLIRKLRRAGFDGPFGGGKHSYMKKGDQRLIIPNPDRGDIGAVLIKKIIRQAGLSQEEWLELD